MSERMRKIFQMVAPGTALYDGLENILRARTGGLIVVGDTPEMMKLVNGGFRLDAEFTPAAVYELAKMDGAIILSEDAERIMYANATLTPDPDIPSRETGLRHSTAERVSKMTGQLVIAISQRRSVITVYYGHTRYVMRDIGVVLAKANQALQTMANYRDSLVKALTNLTALEFIEEVTLVDVARVVQRYELMRRVGEEVSGYIAELGTEGRLVKIQADEVMSGMAEEVLFVAMDYMPDGGQVEAEKLMNEIAGWAVDEVLDLATLSRALTQNPSATPESSMSPRGYRALSKISRLPLSVIGNVVEGFGSLKAIRNATVEELDEIEGIGEVRARAVREGLARLRDQVVRDLVI
ncbi:MAG TPA: DNA integrity scanning diadenylate cyclase DisA [Bacillota bacterium]|nr:DNA integrity scanning protein DisA [Bacillota bacterium]HOB43014.1 DNA integrity scanning diadenylate cyclase DisA [Bacillota bacterium]HOO30656.1 DNA integrity scanning diadenylate cyclase DisA [Bacillota bacterium]HPZ14034.1 DNA integrity scanning diadenylate cyclase DisA [Bacillota bacterium]HQD80710.1 DNA integrity scanning diadenylate cyclase DisA [Bacillota bacterium]